MVLDFVWHLLIVLTDERSDNLLLRLRVSHCIYSIVFVMFVVLV